MLTERRMALRQTAQNVDDSADRPTMRGHCGRGREEWSSEALSFNCGERLEFFPRARLEAVRPGRV